MDLLSLGAIQNCWVIFESDMMKRIAYLLVIFWCFTGHPALSQSAADRESIRGESRLGAKLTYEPIKDLDLSVEEQVRFKTYGDFFDENLVELVAKYELWKNWDLGVGYRYSNANDDEGNRQGFRVVNRLHYLLNYKINFERSELGFRLQYQHRKRRDHDGEWSEWEKNTMRYKVMYEYDIKDWKLDPEFAIVYFNEDAGIGFGENDKYRAILGSTWRLPGPQDLKFKVMYEGGLGQSEQIPTVIGAVFYTYDLK